MSKRSRYRQPAMFILTTSMALIYSLFSLEELGHIHLGHIVKQTTYIATLLSPAGLLIMVLVSIAKKGLKLAAVIIALSVLFILDTNELVLRFISASSPYVTHDVIWTDPDFSLHRIELKRQDVGALGYNWQEVEVLQLKPLCDVIIGSPKDQPF